MNGLIKEKTTNKIARKTTNDKVSVLLKEEKTQVICLIREEDVFNIKAVNGNEVVVLDKTEYLERSITLIKNGPYIKLAKKPVIKNFLRSKNYS